MREVLRLATELGNAILKSDVYARLSEARQAVDARADVREAVDAYEQARSGLKGCGGVNPQALRELQLCRERLDRYGEALALLEARQAFDEMLDNCSRIIRLIVNGETEPEDAAAGCGGCPGCGG